MDDEALKFGIEPIAHLISDRWLSVPRFQRPYAWERTHVQEYWDDLKAGLQDGHRPYFLGAIVISTGGIDGRDQIIDGQQRLITTSILLAAMRDQYRELGADEDGLDVQQRFLAVHKRREGSRPKIRVSDDDVSYYESVVLDQGGYTPNTASQRRLRDALMTIKSLLSQDLEEGPASPLERVHTWLDYLEKSVKVFVINTRTTEDAFFIFETLNDRGAPLTVADLLKNYLMSLPESDIDLIQQGWLEAVASLGTEVETQDFVSFLRYFWSSREGATRERDLYQAIRISIVNGDSAHEFVESLAASSRTYAAMLDPGVELWDAYPEEMRSGIATLLGLKLGQYRPLLLAALDVWEPSKTTALVRSIISWAFRGLIVGGVGGGTTERYFAQAATRVRRREAISVADVFDAMRPVVPDDEEFRAAFESASLSRPAVAAYAIRSLERELSGAEFALLDDSSRSTSVLSHVLPKKAKSEDWLGFPATDLNRYVHRVGNLALVEGSSTLSSTTWQGRKEYLLNGTGFHVNGMLQSYDQWTPDTIRYRQQDLAAVAVRAWPRVGVK